MDTVTSRKRILIDFNRNRNQKQPVLEYFNYLWYGNAQFVLNCVSTSKLFA